MTIEQMVEAMAEARAEGLDRMHVTLDLAGLRELHADAITQGGMLAAAPQAHRLFGRDMGDGLIDALGKAAKGDAASWLDIDFVVE